MLELRVSALDHPDAVTLDGQVQEYYRRVYGDGDATPVAPADFAAPRGLFLVGYDGDRAVVTGAWRAVDAAADDPVRRDGDAEVKRMYVVPDARGKGHARTLLAELERTADAAGRRRMILETGTAQPEAISLYRACGYRPIGRFGVYRDDHRSRCFGKPLRT
ncbi:Histone acetyltransferase HPA2 [Pseudonocardia sp. Ae168_Ps1]|nr:Histone acetyltransferase HPA2 [Pseudonocardia sp. Ae150A_Ps1]OLL82389.1 Histone acetyltransferase HPA2 [Pseudonocardia sp. Ae168_Ps1]OLL83496.1 Histone acetyltransferase HPA2 [Pseudonocardia sp. Ae263_Ps1]OLL90465.1 Histone acetyltransferase HPA2 [Pseudonocardia sp. Ae356_Ps1]